MTETTKFGDAPPAGPGHNLPEDVRQFEDLKKRTEQFVETANRWLNERPELKNEGEAEKAADFLRQLRALANSSRTGTLDKARQDFNTPHQQAIDANNERYRPIISKIDLCQKALKKLQTAWLDKKDEELKEQQRKAREEAERKQREAEEAAKAAAEEQGGDVIGRQFEAEEAERKAEEAKKQAERVAKSKVTTGSAFGARGIGLRRREVPVITDINKIPARALRTLCAKPYVLEALHRALREDIEFARKLDGVEIQEKRSAA